MEEEKLTMSLYRIYKHIEDTIKEHGDISQFKEDVLYVINELLAKPIKVSTAVEIVVRNEERRINKMQREKDEEHIRKLKCKIDDLEKEKQADKEKIKELEEIEKIHQEESGELRKEINEENKRCMILAVENQDLKEKRISKDKIRTRIDEIQSKINNGKTDYCVIDFEFQIKMLQELLKDGGE